jgi:hypothetical protein
METPVILSIGRCPMIVAMSPLGSKMPEIYLSNYLASSVVLANLQIYEFTHLRLQAGRKPIPLNPPSPRGTSADEANHLDTLLQIQTDSPLNTGISEFTNLRIHEFTFISFFSTCFTLLDCIIIEMELIIEFNKIE